MLRLPLILALGLPLAAMAQSQALPTININVAGDQGTPGSTGEGSISVSGKINLPPGWKLSIHTLTIRYAKQGGSTTLNTFIPVKSDSTFNSKLQMKSGSYSVWAVIDVKDAEGRERQISSSSSNVNVQ
jgi:uncharacterized lipoprotein YbaY